MENEQDISTKLRQLQQIKCEFQKDHTDEMISLLCTDERCKSKNLYLQPMCPICLDENVHKQENHKEKSLRVFLKKIIDNNNNSDNNNIQNKFQNQNLPQKTKIIDDLKEMKKNLKMAQNNMELIIEEINKTLVNLDAVFDNDVSSQITQILKSTDYQNLKKQLEQLETQLQVDQQQQQYQIKVKNQNQNEIDFIQNCQVNKYKNIFDDLAKKTFEYQQTYDKVENQKQYQYTGNLSKELLSKNKNIQFRNQSSNNNSELVSINQIFIQERKFLNYWGIVLADQQINKIGTIKFGLKIMCYDQCDILLGIIDIQRAKQLNFNIHDVWDKIGHYFYSISGMGTVYCSNNEELNFKSISPIKFQQNCIIVCECNYQNGTLIYSSSVDNHRVKYTLLFDNSDNNQLVYHPFVQIQHRQQEVLFLNEVELQKYI